MGSSSASWGCSPCQGVLACSLVLLQWGLLLINVSGIGVCLGCPPASTLAGQTPLPRAPRSCAGASRALPIGNAKGRAEGIVWSPKAMWGWTLSITDPFNAVSVLAQTLFLASIPRSVRGTIINHKGCVCKAPIEAGFPKKLSNRWPRAACYCCRSVAFCEPGQMTAEAVAGGCLGGTFFVLFSTKAKVHRKYLNAA